MSTHGPRLRVVDQLRRRWEAAARGRLIAPPVRGSSSSLPTTGGGVKTSLTCRLKGGWSQPDLQRRGRVLPRDALGSASFHGATHMTLPFRDTLCPDVPANQRPAELDMAEPALPFALTSAGPETPWLPPLGSAGSTPWPSLAPRLQALPRRCGGRAPGSRRILAYSASFLSPGRSPGIRCWSSAEGYIARVRRLVRVTLAFPGVIAVLTAADYRVIAMDSRGHEHGGIQKA